MLSDTKPDVEQFQIELMRKATPARRAAIACSLTQTVVQLSKRAIRRAHPDASRLELDTQFIALHYGSMLAEAFRRYMESRK